MAANGIVAFGILFADYETCGPESMSDKHGHPNLPATYHDQWPASQTHPGKAGSPTGGLPGGSVPSNSQDYSSNSSSRGLPIALAEVPPPSCAQRTDTPGWDAAGMRTGVGSIPRAAQRAWV